MNSSVTWSASESTRRMVDAVDWASTARHASPAYSRALDASAGGVQVINGADEAGRLANQTERRRAESAIVAVHPRTRRTVVGPGDGDERTKQPHAPGGGLPRLRARLALLLPVRYARHRGGADADHVGQVHLRHGQQLRRADSGAREDGRRVRRLGR